jgi:putative tricarboxylic transport membrane protein
MIERVVPLIVLVGTGIYLSQALSLPIGTTAQPGPGFFPVAVAAFACVVGLAATAIAFRTSVPARAGTAADAEDPMRRRRVVGAEAALAAFCLVLPWIGYLLAAFGFVAVVLQRLGSRWSAALTTAALSAGGSYYLFAVLLDVPLPRGPW